MALLLPNLLCSVVGQNLTQELLLNNQRTLSVGYIIFPGFEPLDVFGPLDIIYQLSFYTKITLATIAHTTGPISARGPPHRMVGGNSTGPLIDLGFMIGPSIIATHTFEDAPALDVIIVPGGLGDFALVQANDMAIEDFLVRRFNAADYVLSVCTGAVSLARAGLLAGRSATTNKSAWAWATSHGSNITWVPSARWVQDGKVWTSSGVAAGMDMMYAFLKYIYGKEKLEIVINGMEYAPHVDQHWDPFSVVFDVPGAKKNRSLTDCIAPAGY